MRVRAPGFRTAMLVYRGDRNMTGPVMTLSSEAGRRNRQYPRTRTRHAAVVATPANCAMASILARPGDGHREAPAARPEPGQVGFTPGPSGTLTDGKRTEIRRCRSGGPPSRARWDGSPVAARRPWHTAARCAAWQRPAHRSAIRRVRSEHGCAVHAHVLTSHVQPLAAPAEPRLAGLCSGRFTGA
jgi:hypothetical protein